MSKNIELKAILITGHLRFEDINHFNNFYNKIKIYDIYISTTKEYEHIAQKITKNYLILSDKEYDVPFQPNLYQWLHLNNIIKNFNFSKKKYDIIYKLRTDILFDKSIFTTNVYTDYFYISTDFCFFASMSTFINVFTDFYYKINHYYKGKMTRYIPINYNNLILCDNNAAMKWHWITYPEIIYPKNTKISFKELKENVQKNLNLLNSSNSNDFTMNSDYLPKFLENSIFSSEKILMIHILNFCGIKEINTQINLMYNRAKWKILELK